MAAEADGAPAPRTIMHVDMDAFFASIEQRDNPELRGKPTLVGGMHRGVVCAASYEARAFGVHSAMPMRTALQRCPQAQVVSPRHHVYRRVSEEVVAIFTRFTPLIERLSLDEAFLDVTGSITLLGPPRHIAQCLLAALRCELDLPASAGIAPCKFVAKIASDLRKPAGLVEVLPAEVASFLAPLPIEKMWGVGRAQAERLHAAGLHTVGDLRQCDSPAWVAQLGAFGRHIAALARGDDARPVLVDAPAKSLGAEQTLAQDIEDWGQLQPLLLAQALTLAARLHKGMRHAQVVTVKLKTSHFRLLTRQMRLGEATADPDVFFAAAQDLLGRFGAAQPVRLVGLAVSALQPAHAARPLFVDPLAQRRARLEDVRAAIGERFGSHKLTRASLLPRR